MCSIITASRSSSLFALTTKQLQEVVSPKSFLKLSISKRFYPTSTSRRNDPLTLLRKRVTTAPFVVNERYYSPTVTTHNEDDGDHFRFPKLTGNILVIGDGDFSYSVALASINQVQGDAQITASSVDTKNDIINKYSEGEKNLNILDLDPNVTLKYKLDVTTPGSIGSEPIWDSIVWNFPYPTKTRIASTQDGSLLLDSFFENLVPALRRRGCVYVSLRADQGEVWDIHALSWRHNLLVSIVSVFDASEIHGYNPKRAYADEDIPLHKCFTTYTICRETDQQIKVRTEYFSQLQKLVDTRGEFYSCCITPSQAFIFLKEEIIFFLGQFWEIYRSKFEKDAHVYLDPLKKLVTNEISNMINWCNTFSVKDTVKASEVNLLLAQEEGRIKISQFCKIYRENIGKQITYTSTTQPKLVETLKILSRMEQFHIEEYSDRVSEVVADCTSAEIYQLLQVSDDKKIDVSRFFEKFETQFKRAPFSRGVDLVEKLQQLSLRKEFKLERKYHSIWLVLCNLKQHPNMFTNSPKRDVKVPVKSVITVTEVHSLLQKEKEIHLSRFSLCYQKKFRREVYVRTGKLLDTLKELSKKGTFTIQQQATQNGISWVVKPINSNTKQKSSTDVNSCDVNDIYNLVKANGKELYCGQFRARFKERYGIDPITKGESVTAYLKKLSLKGKFVVQKRGSSSSYLVIQNQNNKCCTAEEICILLKKNKRELNAGEFGSRFKEEFGRSPFPTGKGKLTKRLQKLSTYGRFKFKKRGSSLWIILSPGK